MSAESKYPIPRKDAFFGIHFDLHPRAEDTELGAETSEENIGALLERVKPDYVQYDCKGHRGLTGYPTKVGSASPGIVRDACAEEAEGGPLAAQRPPTEVGVGEEDALRKGPEPAHPRRDRRRVGGRHATTTD